MNTPKAKILNLIYWIIILIVSASMMVYGLGKPLQFSGYKSADLNHMSGHDVMWTFYSYSMALPIIIGVFEVAGAVLILFNRTRILGCFLLSTLLVNIILQDYIYEISALGSAVYYQLLIFIILAFDSAKLKRIINELFKSDKKEFSWVIFIIALVFVAVLKFLETKVF